MIRYRYLYIFLILIFALIAFKLYSTADQDNKASTVAITTVEKPKKPPKADEISEVIAKYDSLISSEIRESGTVGAAVVITYKDEIAYLKCFGVQKAGRQELINENTIFRLASVSKTVTGVLAGILSEQKIIGLHDKVVDYLPGFKLKSKKSTENLTIAHLLSHTSGIVPHAYDNLVEEHVPFPVIMDRLKEVDISADPGRIYGYQNVMFSLYDTILSVQTNKDYGTILKEKIFLPFGMKDASASFEEFKNSNNKAYPHYGNKTRYRSLKLNDRYYSTVPAAGVNASISDMSHFLLALQDESSKAMNENVLDCIFTPRIKTPLKRGYFKHWDRLDSKQYSIGWRVIGYKNRNVAYHGGYVRGYKAEIALCKEENIGIAFLSNSPNSSNSKSVPLFLNLLFKFKDQEKLQALNNQNETDTTG